MKLYALRSTLSVLEMDDGTLVLFSYATAVALRYQRQYYVTTRTYSTTTTRHIRLWLEMNGVTDTTAIDDRQLRWWLSGVRQARPYAAPDYTKGAEVPDDDGAGGC